MDVIKQSDKIDQRVTSRYTVVLAAAKRARQITDGANPLTYAPTDRAVSIAVKEMQEGKLRLKIQEELLMEDYERITRDQLSYRMTALSKDDLREDLKDDYAPIYTPSTDDDDSAPELFADEMVDDEVAELFADGNIEKDEDFDIYGDVDEDDTEDEEDA